MLCALRCAMGIDEVNTIQARNSVEKMLAHQLAGAHAVIMEQLGQVHIRDDGETSAKRLTAIARGMRPEYQSPLTKEARQRHPIALRLLSFTFLVLGPVGQLGA